MHHRNSRQHKLPDSTAVAENRIAGGVGEGMGVIPFPRPDHRFIAKLSPSLKANTFGVGVRFRSHKEWCKLFESLGFKVVGTKIGEEEFVSLPRRLLLIKNCRRDSFLLEPIR